MSEFRSFEVNGEYNKIQRGPREKGFRQMKLRRKTSDLRRGRWIDSQISSFRWINFSFFFFFMSKFHCRYLDREKKDRPFFLSFLCITNSPTTLIIEWRSLNKKPKIMLKKTWDEGRRDRDIEISKKKSLKSITSRECRRRGYDVRRSW